MQTLTLQEAAKLLKMTPVGLRRKAAAGEVPASKPGKCWTFIEEDLINFIRSQYKKKIVNQLSSNEQIWQQYMKETDTGIFPSRAIVEEYESLLGSK